MLEARYVLVCENVEESALSSKELALTPAVRSETSEALRRLCTFEEGASFRGKQEMLRTPKVVFLRRRDSLLRCEARQAKHSEGCVPSKKCFAQWPDSSVG